MPPVRRERRCPLTARRTSKLPPLEPIPEHNSDSDSSCDSRLDQTLNYVAAIEGKVLTKLRLPATRPSVLLFFADGATYEIKVKDYDPRCTSFRAKIELDPHTEDLLLGSLSEACLDCGMRCCCRETPDLNCVIPRAALRDFGDKALRAPRLDHWEYDVVKHKGLAIRLTWEGVSFWCCITAVLEARNASGWCYERKFHDVYVDRREGHGAEPGAGADIPT